MPALVNVRWELFARHVAGGVPAYEAYKLAGFRVTNDASARAASSRLLQNVTVANRVSELQSQVVDDAVKRSGVSKSWVLSRLQEVVERCMQAEPVYRMEGKERVETGEYRFDASGANRSLELLGKELGMFNGEADDFPEDTPSTGDELAAARARMKAIGEG